MGLTRARSTCASASNVGLRFEFLPITRAENPITGTGHKIPLGDGFFVADPSTGEWSFVSVDAPVRRGDYNLSVACIVKSPAALVDWIAQLNGKTWFDSKKFVDFNVSAPDPPSAAFQDIHHKIRSALLLISVKTLSEGNDNVLKIREKC